MVGGGLGRLGIGQLSNWLDRAGLGAVAQAVAARVGPQPRAERVDPPIRLQEGAPTGQIRSGPYESNLGRSVQGRVPIFASIMAIFEGPVPRLRFSAGSLGSSKLHVIRLGSLQS